MAKQVGRALMWSVPRIVAYKGSWVQFAKDTYEAQDASDSPTAEVAWLERRKVITPSELKRVLAGWRTRELGAALVVPTQGTTPALKGSFKDPLVVESRDLRFDPKARTWHLLEPAWDDAMAESRRLWYGEGDEVQDLGYSDEQRLVWTGEDDASNVVSDPVMRLDTSCYSVCRHAGHTHKDDVRWMAHVTRKRRS